MSGRFICKILAHRVASDSKLEKHIQRKIGALKSRFSTSPLNRAKPGISITIDILSSKTNFALIIFDIEIQTEFCSVEF